MLVVKQVQFGSRGTHPIVFGSNALFNAEKVSGLSIERLAFLMQVGRAGYQHSIILLWAALENGRMRFKTRPEPFTLEEVGDMLDEVGGVAMAFQAASDGFEEVEQEDGTKVRKQTHQPLEMHPVGAAFMEAWKSAFPQPRPLEEGMTRPPEVSVPAGTSS
jgi:hypothetical protein